MPATPSRSNCEPHRPFIAAEAAKGRNAVAIYQASSSITNNPTHPELEGKSLLELLYGERFEPMKGLVDDLFPARLNA